jgi:hypothetical protein
MRAPVEIFARRVFALFALSSAGCFSPQYQSGHLQCGLSNDCPPGFHCAIDDHCWRDGDDPHPDLSSVIPDLTMVMLDMTGNNHPDDMHIDMSGNNNPDMPADMSGDMAGMTPLDMPALDMTQFDLAPVQSVPSTVWISSGGGSLVAAASGTHLNVSIGGVSVVGKLAGTATGISFTSGYFSEDSIP